MKAYDVPYCPEYSESLNLAETITDFLIYVLYNNMPQEKKNKHFPKGCISIKYLYDYRNFFIYAYLGNIVDQLTVRNIDTIYDEIGKLKIYTDSEKSYLAILRKIDPTLSGYHFPELVKIATVRDYLILKALRLFGNEVNQFLSILKPASYLKVASLGKTAEKS